MSKKVARREDDNMAITRLRRLDVIEGLLDFDLPTLIEFADEIAEKRQSLTRQVQRSSRMRMSRLAFDRPKGFYEPPET